MKCLVLVITLVFSFGAVASVAYDVNPANELANNCDKPPELCHNPSAQETSEASEMELARLTVWRCEFVSHNGEQFIGMGISPEDAYSDGLFLCDRAGTTCEIVGFCKPL